MICVESVKSMINLTGKTILTGAAGRVGAETARLAVASGASVILCDVNLQGLQNLHHHLASLGRGSIVSIEADATTEEGIDYLLSMSLKEVENITSAVHSAYPTSPAWGKPFEELKAEFLNQDLVMQLGGAILFSKKIISYFLKQGGGDLIHISSIQGLSAPKFAHYEGTSMSSPIEYSAIKSGIISITRWLAKYYANNNIRVNCVSPGGIIDKQPGLFVEKYRASCTNIGMLEPMHVANAILFLLSSESIAVNGHNFVVDDGWHL